MPLLWTIPQRMRRILTSLRPARLKRRHQLPLGKNSLSASTTEPATPPGLHPSLTLEMVTNVNPAAQPARRSRPTFSSAFAPLKASARECEKSLFLLPQTHTLIRAVSGYIHIQFVSLSATLFAPITGGPHPSPPRRQSKQVPQHLLQQIRPKVRRSRPA